MTSHAAVVARGLGRCAVVGASALQIDYEEEAVSTREYTVRRDELITLDGNTGEVLIGEVPLAVSHLVADDALKEVLSWTGKAGLRVYALADTMAEWQLGRELQASGIVFRRHRPIPASASLPDATRQREPSVLVLSELSPSPPPSRLGTELSDATDEELLLGAATGCDFVMLSFDLGQKLDETVRLLRSVVPKLHLGLCTTRLHSDEVTVVARALALGLDFVACPPLRTAIARVAAAHPPINK